MSHLMLLLLCPVTAATLLLFEVGDDGTLKSDFSPPRRGGGEAESCMVRRH